MTKTKCIGSLVAMVMGLIMLAPGVSAKAFGIAPPYIVNDNLKPGSNFVYVIDLNTNDPSEAMKVETEITGDPELSEWLTIQNKDSLMMPVGENHVPMHVGINVPKDAKLGNYKGSLRVKVVPVNVKNPQDIAILLGGNIAVELDVINYDVTDYWVKSVAMNTIKVGQPASMRLQVKNLGNTVLSELPAEVELYDYKTNELVAKGTGSQLTAQIHPHTVKEAEMTLDFPDLPIGQYWAKVNVKKGRESVYQNRLYMAVDDLDVNNSLKTSVDVTTDKNFKAAAQALEPPVDAGKTNVNVATTVTVRAPLTNQLIGVVIALLGIIVIVTSRIYIVVKKRRR